MAQLPNIQVDYRTSKQKENEEAMEKEQQKYGTGYSDKTKVPLDTKDPRDHGVSNKEVMINLDAFKSMNLGMSGVQEQDKVDADNAMGESADPQRSQKQGLSCEELFTAVSNGDVAKLKPLENPKTADELMQESYRRSGKTALMQALLNLKDGKNDTVEYLLGIASMTTKGKNYCTDLVNAAFADSTDYAGMTALHIAIERRSKHHAQMLLEKGANVQAKAHGTFFKPHDQTSWGPEVHGRCCGAYCKPRSTTCFYFGELPLSLAACTNQKDMVDLLLEHKADIRHTDSLGNTVLHALVMVADNSSENTDFVISMYDYILTQDALLNPQQKAFEDIENNQGLTPINLAAKLGRNKMFIRQILSVWVSWKNRVLCFFPQDLLTYLSKLFQHILQREFQQENRHLSRKFTEWTYGPVISSIYDLNYLDTYEKNSVLEMLVYGTVTPSRLDMLQVEPLKELLQDKWNRFACMLFWLKFITYFIYVCIFTTFGYQHGEGKFTNATETILWMITALGAAYFLIKGLMDVKATWPIIHTLLKEGYTDLLFFFQAVLFVVSVALFAAGKREYATVLASSMALSWVNLLYFFRGSKTLGIHCIMIQRIVFGDLLRFGLVFIIFLVGFSVAVVTLFTSSPPDEEVQTNQTHIFTSISTTSLEMFKLTIGIGELDFSDQFQYKEAAYVLLITYLVLTYILLLNMLIALMSKSVETMSEESIKIWHLQRAIAILEIEKSLYFLKDRLRSGIKRNLEVVSNKKEDWRWCMRVDELHWKELNQNMSNNQQSLLVRNTPFSETDSQSCSTDEVPRPTPDSHGGEGIPLVSMQC